MEVYEVDSVVRRHHVFKEIWTPFIGEDLECKRDVSNTRDAYAVGIMRQEETGLTAIVGHVPRKISSMHLSAWIIYTIKLYWRIKFGDTGFILPTAKYNFTPIFPAIR